MRRNAIESYLHLPKALSAFQAKDLRLLPWSLIGRTVQLFGSVTEVQGWAFFRQFRRSSEVSLPVVPHSGIGQATANSAKSAGSSLAGDGGF